MSMFYDYLTDQARIGVTDTETTTYNLSPSDNVRLYGLAAGCYGLTINANLTLSDPLSYKWVAGAAMNEVLRLRGTTTPKMLWSVTALDVARIAAGIAVGMPAYLSAGVTLQSIVQVVHAVILAQKMFFGVTGEVQVKFGQTIADGIRLNAAFAQFMNISLDENLSLATLSTYRYHAVTSMSDNVRLITLLSDTISFNVTMQEGVEIQDDSLLNMIFQGDPLLERILLGALYVSPDGNFTTWAINTRTNSVSEYENWAFNSFAPMGHKYVGANQYGLYELNGETDDGENIIAMIETGLMQLAGTKLAGIKGLYLGMKVSQGDNTFFIKLAAGDGREYVYRIISQPNQMTTKVNIGKGLRSRYLSFKLISTGPDFNLDTVEFVPMIGKRRV